MADDFYRQLLAWSSNNILAVGLEKSVYLWDATTGLVDCLAKGREEVASLTFDPAGHYLAVGNMVGDVDIWDLDGQTCIRQLRSHSRTGILTWSHSLLSTGCSDGSIVHLDVRLASYRVAQTFAHSDQICGLVWHNNEVQLASGGNDNLVFLWDMRSICTPIARFTGVHRAAVKAIAWCPWQANLLATGGGLNDGTLQFWDTTRGKLLYSIETDSQVSSIIWSRERREFLTAHGFPRNQLALWHYPSLHKHGEIPAHESRVLHTAVSPSGQVVATCAADENLKFWHVFKPSPTLPKKNKAAIKRNVFNMQNSIR
ncbi:uncharacterized protein VTP21DRAFT_8964 [Calcarisporiella thermophila]|uniref:uncharacterized protein n=1 Tax=Calcarisporiella thermophila TaxID=911321 RepID=UPI00374313DD